MIEPPAPDKYTVPVERLVLSAPLIVIRHGQTDWNKVGRLQGQKDIPLNDTGRAQAKRNGEALENLITGGTFTPETYFMSPLGRTRETMKIVQAELSSPAPNILAEAAIQELTFGAWEGMTLDEVGEHDPVGYRARKTDRWGHVPPEGESYEQLSFRIRAWAETLDRPTVAVAHGGVIRVLTAMVQGSTAGVFGKAPPHQDKLLLITSDALEWI